MVKITQIISKGGKYKYPNINPSNQRFVGISIIAPLPNLAVIQFDNDPVTYPIETIQCLKCSFSGFTIINNDTSNPVSVTIYLQTDPHEFLPCPHDIQTQVTLNENLSTPTLQLIYSNEDVETTTDPVTLNYSIPSNKGKYLLLHRFQYDQSLPSSNKGGFYVDINNLTFNQIQRATFHYGNELFKTDAVTEYQFDFTDLTGQKGVEVLNILYLNDNSTDLEITFTPLPNLSGSTSCKYYAYLYGPLPQ